MHSKALTTFLFGVALPLAVSAAPQGTPGAAATDPTSSNPTIAACEQERHAEWAQHKHANASFLTQFPKVEVVNTTVTQPTPKSKEFTLTNGTFYMLTLHAPDATDNCTESAGITSTLSVIVKADDGTPVHQRPFHRRWNHFYINSTGNYYVDVESMASGESLNYAVSFRQGFHPHFNGTHHHHDAADN
ncbi:MAG: hypothetical protein M1838_003731 [Thelocarpon superellum]|nr:MAG: hypothetical protein M1838_003731 [Thelocarpon superellum]